MKILILDIETTGFIQNGGKIVEIGLVELDLTNGNTKIVFDSMTHEKGITLQEVENSWIINNSDMTVDDIRHSPSLSKIHAEVQSILDAYPNGCTAYNNVFDFGFFERAGFKFPKKLPCPMKVATNVVKIPSPRGGYKWPSVQESWDFFFGKTDYVEKHRGADDAVHEAKIVYKLYQDGHFLI